MLTGNCGLIIDTPISNTQYPEAKASIKKKALTAELQGECYLSYFFRKPTACAGEMLSGYAPLMESPQISAEAYIRESAVRHPTEVSRFF